MAYFHPQAAQVPHQDEAQYYGYAQYPLHIPPQPTPAGQPQHPHHFPGIPRRRSDIDQRVSNDSKPRLSKEQHDFLEHFFMQQPKPSTSTKKGFADTLGVPLDKVNNWFQNRRAKVKQEAKKAQNASLFYNNHHGQHTLPSQLMPDARTFSGAHDATPRQSMILNGPMPVPTGDFMDSLLFSNDPMASQGDLEGMQTSIMPMEDSHSDAQAEAVFLGLEDPRQLGVTPDFDAVSNIGKQFGSDQEFAMTMQRPRFSIASYHTSSSSLLTGSSGSNVNSSRVSSEDCMNDLSGMDMHPQSLPSSASSISQSSSHAHNDSMNQMLLPPGPQSFSFGADGLLQSGQQMLDQSAMWTTQGPMGLSQDGIVMGGPPSMQEFFNAQAMQDMQMQMMAQNHGQALVGQHQEMAQMNQQQMQDVHGPEQSQHHHHHHRDKTTETLSAVPGPSTLATRRQRRPAALGISTARSASYTGAGSELSPGIASPTSHTSDPHLRRIKSSAGVISGRIQKSGYSSAGRSPLSLTFAESSVSSPVMPTDMHKIGRTNSMPSVSEASEYTHPDMSGHIDSIPMTVPEHESDQMESDWANMPSTAGTAPSVSAWSHMPGTAESIHSFQSPPVSPLGIDQPQRFTGPGMMEEPRSAPPYQSTFQLPEAMVSGPLAGNDQPRVLQSPLAFRPSTSGEDSSSMTQSRKVSPKSTCRSPTDSNSSGTIQGSPTASRNKVNTPHYGMFQSMPSGSQAGSPTYAALRTPERPEPKELEIHHYTPPGHEDTNEAAKQKSPQPKKYDWISQGPRDFSGSP